MERFSPLHSVIQMGLGPSCGSSRFEGCNKFSILLLLREFETRVIVPLLEVSLPVAVKGVDNPLSVVLTCAHDVALVLLHLEADAGEATLDAPVHEIKSSLDLVLDILLSELVLVAHPEDVLLCVAAAVLDCLDDVAVAHIYGIYDTFSREADLSAYLLDSRAHGADSSLQLVEVAVETCRECGDGIVIALDCRHQQVAVVVVGHLIAESVNLSLYFSALETSVSEAESVTAEKRQEDEVHPRVVHPIVCASIHCGHQSHRISVFFPEHCSCEDVIVASVATIDFVHHFRHNMLVLVLPASLAFGGLGTCTSCHKHITIFVDIQAVSSVFSVYCFRVGSLFMQATFETAARRQDADPQSSQGALQTPILRF